MGSIQKQKIFYALIVMKHKCIVDKIGGIGVVLLLFLFPYTKAQDKWKPYEVLEQSRQAINSYKDRSDEDAIELISNVIAAKKDNNIGDGEIINCDRYEKINVGWVNLTQKERNRIYLRYFNFLFEHTDTSDVTNEPIQYVMSREKFESLAYKKGRNIKLDVKAVNRDWVDEMLNEQGIKAIADEAFSGFSIYDNNIKMLLQNFVGPLSMPLAKSVYKYVLNDSIEFIDGEACHIVDFEPHNPRILGFRGRLYILDDGSYAVRRAVLCVQNEQNLNFVDNIVITHDYAARVGGYRLLSKDDVSIEVSLLKAFVRRIGYFSNHKLNQMSNQEYNALPILFYRQDAWNQPDEYWTDKRPLVVSDQEFQVKNEIKNLYENNKGSFWGYLGASVFENAFDLGKFEVGPLTSMVSRNDIEGFRFRLGGTTTSKFSKRLFLEGYGAYGTEDKTWKYYAQAEYLFRDIESYPTEFPVHSLALSIKNDVSFPGQDLVSVNKENLFYSFRRYPIERMYLIRSIGLRYMREYQSGFSYKLTADVFRESPLGELYFESRQPDGSVKQIASLSKTELGLTLRYAPQEKFYQRRYSRYYLSNNNPILTLSHKMGLKGIWGSQYNSNLTEFSIFQRINASLFGHFDTMIKLGKQWNKVPYPFLIIPQANPSYFQIKETFDLMNVMEFISDQYISWDTEYHLNGALFNLLPVNRYLKFREVISFKGYIGALSDKNNPKKNPDTFLFPLEQSGNPISYKMNGMPYMELGVGIDNIFRFMRIDYVWRLTYRNHPDISKSGIRIGLNLMF